LCSKSQRRGCHCWWHKWWQLLGIMEVLLVNMQKVATFSHLSTFHMHWSHEVKKFNLMWHYLFWILYFCFCKGLEMMGSDKIHTAPHVHMYMFCPYVISTLYCLVEEYKWELSKDTFFFCILLTTLQLREMN
jgi:hypothetical protein